MSALALQALALATTLAVELPIAAALARPAQRRALLLTALFANLASHAIASLILGLSRHGSGVHEWLAVELGVVAFEALALHAAAGLPRLRAVMVAFAMNVPSAALSFAFA